MENRILLIEDDPDITELVRINLEDAGYRLDSAADGEKGLETALAQEIASSSSTSSCRGWTDWKSAASSSREKDTCPSSC